MLRYHMVVVTADGNLRRAIKRVATSTGATAEFIPDMGQLAADRPPHVLVFDARQKDPPKDLGKKLSPDAHIIFIVEGDNLIPKVKLLEDGKVASLFCYDERFDDDEFIASATKALRGEVFGLQKYFPWGVTSYSMTVTNYEEKGRAIEALIEYAAVAGCRGAVKDRIQLVCDELMMNALYHAPVDASGNELYAGKTQKELSKLDQVSAIRVQYSHSGRYFGVSVRDQFGSLSRPKLLEYLRRAAKGAEIEKKASGAGLGLVSVLRSVSKLVFNLEPKSSSEVIALFDMELFAKGKIGARSLHIFTASASSEDQRVADRGRLARQDKPGLSGGMIAAIALLSAVLVVLATLLVVRKKGDAGARPLVVEPVPGQVIKLDGQVVAPGEPVDLPEGDGPVRLTVEAKP
jgi:hypothetical protein